MHVTHPVFGTLTLSDEQAHIVNEIGAALLSETIDGRRKMIRARAGSGKTTVLVIAAYLHRQHYEGGIYAAFGRTLGDDVNPKLVGSPMTAINFHKLGYRVFGQVAPRALNKKGIETQSPRIRVNKAKQYWQAREFVDARYDAFSYNNRAVSKGKEIGQKIELTNNLVELIDKARLNLISPLDRDAVLALCEHYGIKKNEWVLSRLTDYMKLNMEAAMKRGDIDYTDMLYVPLRHAHLVEWPPTPLLFLDECQDMSALSMEFMLKFTNEQSVIIGSGDPAQSIMGFAGAMSNSFDLVAERIGVSKACYLPMSISRRSAKRIIELAQDDVPDIQAMDDAPDGRVDFMHETRVVLQAQSGDFILSRTTAPLITLWLDMSVAGLPVTVRGQEDEKDNIKKHLDKIAKQHMFDFRHFPRFVEQYIDLTLDNMRENDASDWKVQKFRDETGIVYALAQCERFRTLQDVYQTLEDMYREKEGDIILMTAHRSKGLEANTVFILKPEKFPLIGPDTQEWEIEQEYNLRYVARTRARRRLVFLTHKDYDVEETPDIATLDVRDWLTVEAMRNGQAETPVLPPASPTSNGHKREALPSSVPPVSPAAEPQVSPQVQQLTLLLEEMSEQDRALLRSLLNRS